VLDVEISRNNGFPFWHYLLVGFVAGGSRAAEAVTMYIVAYVVTSFAAFGCVTVLSEKTVDS